jgi:molybdenum cofactor cytidylyltransferase
MTGKICAVVLAAGLSTRTKKKYKLTLKLAGKTIIEKCIEPFLSVCDKVIVVTGHNKELVEKALKNKEKVETVYNSNFQKGMFTSVKAGIKALKNCDRFFFTPGDYPFYSEKLLKTMLKNKSNVIIPTFNNKKGHPVLIDGKYIENILTLSDDLSLRTFINSVTPCLLSVDEDSVLKDIDTLKDYEKVLENYEKQNIKSC